MAIMTVMLNYAAYLQIPDGRKAAIEEEGQEEEFRTAFCRTIIAGKRDDDIIPSSIPGRPFQ